MWIEPARLKASLVGPKEFSFFGKQADLDSVGWDGPQIERLWRYNQHYFEDLVAEAASERRGWHQALVQRWVLENQPGKGTGWEPYPTSRRIVNWIKWAIEGGKLSEQAIHSLAVQARWLERRLEWHLLGNHLLANAQALVFAGTFFDGKEAQRWLEKGVRILDSQLDEQILEDGGHFELSPMYHAIVLRDMLDLYNLAGTFCQISLLNQRRSRWAEIINRMRIWLLVMSHPDGDIAFFNDAALGVAPSTLQLEAYAHRLMLSKVPGPCDGLTHLTKSGYIRLQGGGAVAILDCAAIGPDYQPGHAHADTLSFELSVRGSRVLVNSGTSTYEQGLERLTQRGTACHNTVLIDAQDSSEVWSAFRVARRARIDCLSIREDSAAISVTARHDGYSRLSGSPRHQRGWRWSKNDIVVADYVEGQNGRAEARFHIHPDWSVESGGQKGNLRGPNGGLIRWLVEKGRPRIDCAAYHPGFGSSVPTSCLAVILEEGRATVRFSWD